MSTIEIDSQEYDRLKNLERMYVCPLRREEMIEHVRQNASEVNLFEVDQLHKEREWLTDQLMLATGKDRGQVRLDFQEAVGYRMPSELSKDVSDQATSEVEKS